MGTAQGERDIRVGSKAFRSQMHHVSAGSAQGGIVCVCIEDTLEKSELLTFLELGITVADVFFTWIL